MEISDGLLSRLELCYIQPANAGKFYWLVCLIILKYTLFERFFSRNEIWVDIGKHMLSWITYHIRTKNTSIIKTYIFTSNLHVNAWWPWRTYCFYLEADLLVHTRNHEKWLPTWRDFRNLARLILTTSLYTSWLNAQISPW